MPGGSYRDQSAGRCRQGDALEVLAADGSTTSEMNLYRGGDDGGLTGRAAKRALSPKNRQY